MCFDIFNSHLLTADPKEHLRRAMLLLNCNNDAFLLYAALELRFAIERIIHNQLSLFEDVKMKNKDGNDPKRKKLIMNILDSESDNDYNIYYIIPETNEKVFWGIYKNILISKVKSIDGKIGDLLHMKTNVNFGDSTDDWYLQTKVLLRETINYLSERVTDSHYYASYINVDNFELEKIEKPV